MLSTILAATTMLTTVTVVAERTGFGDVAAVALEQPQPANPAPGDACSLLTKEDAAAALGESVTGPKSTGPIKNAGQTASGCDYEGSGLNRIHLNLIQLAAGTVSMYRAMCAEKNRDGLAGLGDIACWYDDKHEELQMLKGTSLVSIEINMKGNPTEAIKGAMKKAAGRLH